MIEKDKRVLEDTIHYINYVQGLNPLDPFLVANGDLDYGLFSRHNPSAIVSQLKEILERN